MNLSSKYIINSSFQNFILKQKVSQLYYDNMQDINKSNWSLYYISHMKIINFLNLNHTWYQFNLLNHILSYIHFFRFLCLNQQHNHLVYNFIGLKNKFRMGIEFTIKFKMINYLDVCKSAIHQYIRQLNIFFIKKQYKFGIDQFNQSEYLKRNFWAIISANLKF
ncbi:hypothetical protein pb186bvf_019061 [Paramecium bursaria]